MSIDQLIPLQDHVYDLPEIREPRVSQAVVPVELSPEDRTVRSDCTTVDQSRRGTRRVSHRTHAAPECHVIGEVCRTPGSQDRVYECLVDALVVVAAGEVHGHGGATPLHIRPSPFGLDVAARTGELANLAAGLINDQLHRPMLAVLAWVRRGR